MYSYVASCLVANKARQWVWEPGDVVEAREVRLDLLKRTIVLVHVVVAYTETSLPCHESMQGSSYTNM